MLPNDRFTGWWFAQQANGKSDVYDSITRANLRKLDTWIVQEAILSAVQRNLAQLEGRILDIGCGRMPYKAIVMAPPSRAAEYIGLDFRDGDYAKLYGPPDLGWDGHEIPIPNSSIDCVMATEVFEQCPDLGVLLKEVARILKSNGLLFFTVPFLWPIHDPPHDQYRFTPFALERFLRCAGFRDIQLEAFGGWNASLAQMIGLWVGRRPMGRLPRALLSILAEPLMRLLMAWDRPPKFPFFENIMITGISGTARRV
jgi:SAM-dependent methyltransferase